MCDKLQEFTARLYTFAATVLNISIFTHVLFSRGNRELVREIITK